MEPGRTPQGVRGLKPIVMLFVELFRLSHSARSAWIETSPKATRLKSSFVALRKECVD